ncbi:shikimate kinase [Thermosipho sp. 1063]|uniref:shikimate kinase n=1 Tax=unclassified Thermosipho (in: thermotogales) TaxID=2676525 RepID=UPI0009494189|nr:MULTISPECIES: shikimate kinase [unclassified Thermosipho (in: thermotogales)]ANQ53461.1 shikimate kinase [Thermosipho sp. 1070]APT71910.1 shikimate kinase [Thermosipho sp. 1063]OOC44842.1 shikimate kinase [Thermosipho sp. 1074]
MPLYIIGLPGSGKSAVGKILKEDFGYDIIDFDEILNLETGKRFNAILLSNGFVTLENLERKFLKRFKRFDEKIIVTLGLIAEKDRYKGKVVYIKVPKEKFIRRIKMVSEKFQNLDDLYEKFHFTFSKDADLVISSENKTKFDIAKIIDDFYRKSFRK